MTPERYQQIAALFQKMSERELASRDTFLAHFCVDDDKLRREVQAMLTADAQAPHFLEGPPDDIAAAVLAAVRPYRALIGRKLGNYRVIARLGNGGMGEVFLAEDTRLGRNVALKLLPEEYLSDPIRLRLFEQEARCVSALNHPNIVIIHDIGYAEGVTFIVMEYVSGKTLSQLIPMEPYSALRYACQIAGALTKAHAAGITHRDIKPANIMITDEGTLKVLDFGVAQLDKPVAIDETALTPTDVTQAGPVLGTPEYMSPEQANGRPVDARSDIYSFGLLLYELLSGIHPYRPMARVGSVRLEEPSPLSCLIPELPAGMDHIITRCLRRDPSRRFQSMLDVRLALEEILSLAPAVHRLPSIAVLPFVNMSPEKNNAYFVDGITEEIINTLMRVSGLKVTARTSAFSFRGKDIQIDEVARRLGVDQVLEGSVRKTGDRVRIVAQLINATDGCLLWSERFDRDMTDVFAIQDEIAEAIVKRLKGQGLGEAVLPKVHRGMPKMDAYEAYLKGRYYLYKYTPASFKKAKQCFESAIVLDPTFALSYCSLAMYHFYAKGTGVTGLHQYLATAEPLLRKALELDPELSEAHALLGVHLGLFEYDWRGAEREFQKALASGSAAADVYRLYAHTYLVPQNRLEEAQFTLARAKQLEPLVPVFVMCAGIVYCGTGDFERSLSACEEALELDETFWFAHLCRASTLLKMGNVTESLKIYESLYEGVGREVDFVVAGRAACLSCAGRKAEACAILRDLIVTRRTRYVSPWTLGMISWAVGELDEAYEFLLEAIDERDNRVLDFVRAPQFLLASKPDPRIQALLRKVNLD